MRKTEDMAKPFWLVRAQKSENLWNQLPPGKEQKLAKILA
jgi:hypothetical protein